MNAQEPAFPEFLTSHGEKITYSPEMLNDLLVTIRCIQKELKEPDTEKVKAAQEAYKDTIGSR